jgi:hypothetical protein
MSQKWTSYAIIFLLWYVRHLCPCVTFSGHGKPFLNALHVLAWVHSLVIIVIFTTIHMLNCLSSCMDFVTIVYRKSHRLSRDVENIMVYHACTAVFGRCVTFISHCWRKTFIRPAILNLGSTRGPWIDFRGSVNFDGKKLQLYFH